MTVAMMAIRLSLAVLVTGTCVAVGLAPIVSAGQTPGSQPPIPQEIPAPAAPADKVPCNTPKPAGIWVCTNGVWMMAMPRTPDPQTAIPPSNLTAGDINPLTGTPVVTPTEITPLPGTGGGTSGYGVIVVGLPGVEPRAAYDAWPTHAGPGQPSPTLGRSTPCASQRPSRDDWYCHDGTWMATLPGSAAATSYDTRWNSPGPGATAYTPATVPVTPVLDPVVTSYGCAGISPGRNYTCLNGSWVVR